MTPPLSPLRYEKHLSPLRVKKENNASLLLDVHVDFNIDTEKGLQMSTSDIHYATIMAPEVYIF